jgi:hypothetical protein
VLLCINRSRGGCSFWGTCNTVNLTGKYTCVGPCTKPQGTATIEQNGNVLTFISEVGTQSKGHFLSARAVSADDWGLRADISADGRTINWSNGVQWIRQ